MILHKQIGLSILCVAFLYQNSYFFTHISLAEFLFVGHGQTVQNQIRRRKTRRLIRFSTVCLQKFLLKSE